MSIYPCCIIVWAFPLSENMILKSAQHPLMWLLLAFFSKYSKRTARSWKVLAAHLGQTSSTGHGVPSDFLSLPLANRAQPLPTEPLGMWEGVVSLLSPFNLDLYGAISAGWVGGFNNAHTCLLEWAQLNNLIWRGRQEIPVKVLRISDFIKLIRDKDFTLKI